MQDWELVRDSIAYCDQIENHFLSDELLKEETPSRPSHQERWHKSEPS